MDWFRVAMISIRLGVIAMKEDRWCADVWVMIVVGIVFAFRTPNGGIQLEPTTEDTSGHKPVVHTSPSALDWICTVKLDKR